MLDKKKCKELIKNFNPGKKLVYIAGPISSAPIHNLKKAIDVWKQLYDNGFVCIVPHLQSTIELIYPIGEKWYEYDLHLLYSCDLLFRIEGKSPGADLEVEFAKENDIPVYYDIEELIKYEK